MARPDPLSTVKKQRPFSPERENNGRDPSPRKRRRCLNSQGDVGDWTKTRSGRCFPEADQKATSSFFPEERIKLLYRQHPNQDAYAEDV